jgi:hypothetical protein
MTSVPYMGWCSVIGVTRPWSYFCGCPQSVTTCSPDGSVHSGTQQARGLRLTVGPQPQLVEGDGVRTDGRPDPALCPPADLGRDHERAVVACSRDLAQVLAGRWRHVRDVRAGEHVFDLEAAKSSCSAGTY